MLSSQSSLAEGSRANGSRGNTPGLTQGGEGLESFLCFGLRLDAVKSDFQRGILVFHAEAGVENAVAVQYAAA